MRTESQIRNDMAAAKSAIQKAREKEPAAVVAELVAKARALNAELVACLRDGANLCPTCAQMPHAMLKRAETYANGELVAGAVYEVGCLAGHPAKDGLAHRAQGSTAAKAVDNWNAGIWLKWTPPGSVTVTVTRKDGTQELRVLKPQPR